MDAIYELMGGFGRVLQPHSLLAGLLGVVAGTIIGVLPGIGPALGIALLLPFTAGMNPTSAMIMFGGVYFGAMYGGSTTGILIHTPGEAASVPATSEGYALTRRGRAGAALMSAAIGSFIGGTVSVLGLVLLAALLYDAGLWLAAPEYFAVMLLALVTVARVAGDDAPKALFAVAFGLCLGMVGIDLQTGQARFTFGLPVLWNGIDPALSAIALFAMGEALAVAAAGARQRAWIARPSGSIGMTREEWRASLPAWLRGSVLGMLIGLVPGAGATLAAFVSHALERRLDGDRTFGRGAISGVAGPEAANNAAAGSAMLPMLTLGIPGSGTTAVMIAAMMRFGITPGPQLMQTNAPLVWTLVASLFVANVLLLLLNLPLARMWLSVLHVPRPLIMAGVLLLGVVAVIASGGDALMLLLLIGLGVAAMFLQRHGFPIAPIALGLLMGPVMEQEFRRGLALSAGDPGLFLQRPLTLVLLLASALMLFVPPLFAHVRRRASKSY